ncbi:MAG: hypothetical protein ACO3GZ_12035 [Ilumatobacteraceae bacterium]
MAGLTICVGVVGAVNVVFGAVVVDAVVDGELVVDDVLDVVEGARVVVVDVEVDVVLVVVVHVVVEVVLDVVVVAGPPARSSDALSTIGPRFPSVVSPATPRM